MNNGNDKKQCKYCRSEIDIHATYCRIVEKSKERLRSVLIVRHKY